MELSKLTEEERAKWWLFMKASPVGVDPNIISPEVMASMPENVKQTIWADSTSSLIYLLGYDNGLNEDQISDIARTVRDVALGNTNSGKLTETLKNKLGTTDEIAQKIATKLTTEIIAPNYFQISQLYEKKHRVGAVPEKTAVPRQPLAGRPLESLEQKRTTIAAASVPDNPVSSMGDWAGEIVANKPSKNVVDLRAGTIPPVSKLPPIPPLAPRNEENTEGN